MRITMSALSDAVQLHVSVASLCAATRLRSRLRHYARPRVIAAGCVTMRDQWPRVTAAGCVTMHDQWPRVIAAGCVTMRRHLSVQPQCHASICTALSVILMLLHKPHFLFAMPFSRTLHLNGSTTHGWTVDHDSHGSTTHGWTADHDSCTLLL